MIKVISAYDEHQVPSLACKVLLLSKETRKVMYRAGRITAVLSLVFSFAGFAQSYRLSDNSEFRIDGTSNVHDWSAVVEDVKASGTGNTNTLEALEVVFKVESMESGDRLMNRRMYSTLNSEEYPEINFTMTGSNRTGNSMTLRGDLTIHGVKKHISVQGQVAELSNGNLRITGSHPVKFTEHGMDPPSFMFGAMKVGDEVKITFNVLLTRQ